MRSGDMNKGSEPLDGEIEASVAARSELMGKLSELIRVQGWTQKQAAARLGVTQPRISDLTRGKIELFSLDTLVDMAAVAGMRPQIVLATHAKRVSTSAKRRILKSFIFNERKPGVSIHQSHRPALGT